METPRRKTLAATSGQATCVGYVDVAAVRQLLRQGTVRFAVDDFLGPIRWHAEEACYEFWKSEALPHLADPDQEIHRERWPGEYAYVASRWDDGTTPIILLEKMH